MGPIITLEYITQLCREQKTFLGKLEPQCLLYFLMFLLYRCSCFRCRRAEQHFQWTQTHTLTQSSKRKKWPLRARPSGHARLQSQVLAAAFYWGAGISNTLKYRMPFRLLNYYIQQWWLLLLSSHLSALFLECVSLKQLPSRLCYYRVVEAVALEKFPRGCRFQLIFTATLLFNSVTNIWQIPSFFAKPYSHSC